MRTLVIFISTFIVVMILNQLTYGGCFESYCLIAALPKVLIGSLIISTVIHFATKDDFQDLRNEKDGELTQILTPTPKLDPQTQTCLYRGVQFSLKGAKNFTDVGRVYAKTQADKMIENGLDVKCSHLIFNKDGLLLNISGIQYLCSIDENPAIRSSSPDDPTQRIHMNTNIIKELSNSSVEDLHAAVKKAVNEDNYTPTGETRPFSVEEMKDWKLWADVLEEELRTRHIKFG